MRESDVVKLIDGYMGNGGYYIKPKISDSETGFFMAKGQASASDVEKSFDLVSEALGNRTEQDARLFEAFSEPQCAVCADIPNLFDIDRE